MDTQDPDNGSADQIEETTAGPQPTLLALLAAKGGFDEESHDLCGTRYLFTPYERWPQEMDSWGLRGMMRTTSSLHLGAAAACQSCKIVLDALISYSNGRFPIENITGIQVISADYPITILYQQASDVISARLELFRLKGQEVHITHNVTQKELPVHTRTLPSEDTSSDRALQTLYSWIETCVEHHGACGGRKIVQLPKRIIEIDGKHVYLRERLSTPAIYACLSHCWGSSGPTIRLDKTSHSRLIDGIVIDQLPKTFSEAIHLCARLNIRFIWIDACCIMQDDKDDWEETAATMANIYQQAHLTIAATWASNSDYGLFAPDREKYKARKLRDCELYVWEERTKFPRPYIQNNPDDFPSSTPTFTDFPLLTRAWVYQERMLSPRMVHFCKDQMYWQCPTMFIAEDGLTYDEIYPRDTKSFTFYALIDDPVIRWHEIVTAYSGLNLTYRSDRLPAIAAIVEREMRLRMRDTYIAGMWLSSLLTDLVWRTTDGSHPRLSRSPSSVPTWAWPSSPTQVGWESGLMLPSLRIVDLTFTRVGPAQIGEVANASITLEGHTCMTRLTRIHEGKHEYFSPSMEIVSPPCESVGLLKRWQMSVDFDWTCDDRPATIGDTFTVVPMIIRHEPDTRYNPGLTHATGLVLREVSDEAFERMGVIYLEVKCGPKTSVVERERILKDFVEAVPIRQVKII